MNKKIIIIFIVVVLAIILVFGGILLSNLDNGNTDTSRTESYNNQSQNYNNIISEEVIETIQDTTITGIVERNKNGRIFIFNGQHFGEFGLEMEEYTSADIENKSQECIDFYTEEKHDTSYISEGDILICKGDLKRYSNRVCSFDTKNNSIIVLKENDYNNLKRKAINNNIDVSISIGEYFDYDKEIYIIYNISDKNYKLPFALKCKITNETTIKGNLEKGKKIKVQYQDVNAHLDQLKLKTIDVVN